MRTPAGFWAESAWILFEIRKGVNTIVEVTNVPKRASMPKTPITIPKTGEAFPILPYALAALCLGVAALCGAAVYRQCKTEPN